ncbi:MAG: tRNA (N6-isopentenyl adenosine(37)-C2)-methylthiotransferase MiaB [Rhodospirillaceae bacterium]|nr:tRNA (N6-isopentenyl adenosine(37)-C2)-methylthiotransferase MiaB [Rhodospirillaceae bacterium]MBT4491577.1 tRNA (N6-isopentenyl adenosine(37)-C2)-methylthiotransferase MiaB [Rhodospirillaceae bacterium]MBT5896917.1 tRNA (N6-isopentenyl adenosine(37)-C2)-methylthiotransferase MiaB [Rhodospirillaceae bacterium]MBT6429021.1 tRNA (N6-isopentenyl adenosine(37)-C2)-methylthiotransferase MiaB [Rhodospirillaceae bacterium]MBT7759751.1 tRNA (N6-isopentenyl adenosine(37)-C2)-methylthiotransferase Mia
MPKKFFIRTYGCQMNVYDTARMADVLAPLGYSAADGPEDADMVILNTCHIREKAAEKVYSELGRLRQMKEQRMADEPDRAPPVLAVAGCVAQAEGAEMLARAPFLDIVFGPQTYHRLPEMIARVERAAGNNKGKSGRGAGILDTEFPAEAKFDHLPKVSPGARDGKGTMAGCTAFLTIQEGCDKFCTFCVVPYTRGVEFSRPGQAVLEECRQLVSSGVREVTLLGQNVNAYHGTGPDGDNWDLAELIARLAGIDGLARIRYTTSHPRDINDRLFDIHGHCEKLMPYLHLPAQSGSDRILAAMNRGYTAADYQAAVARLRRIRPDIALSGDFIVGFPGESEADFEATMELVRAVKYAQAYSFKYSPRPGTPAALLEDQVPDEMRSERLQRLQALLDDQQQAFNRQMVGKRLPLLLDRGGRRPGQLVGRSPYMQAVHLDASVELLGRMVEVEITAAHANSLAGQLVEPALHRNPRQLERVR